jgi:hypothetical protein
MSITTKKILIVTANSKIRDLAAFAFDVVARWQVFSASSLSECLTTATSDVPDAILIDNGSCGGDVIGLAEKLYQGMDTRPVPMLLLQPAAGRRPKLNFHPLLLGVVSESTHPRKLVTEVAQLLGWQPGAITNGTGHACTRGS